MGPGGQARPAQLRRALAAASLLTLVLVLLWILLLNSFSFGGLLMGVVLGRGDLAA